MPSQTRKKGLVQWQPMMVRVLYALGPIALASMYFFGWRSLAALVLCNAAAFAVEYIFCRQNRQQVSSAVFVTGSLLALSLPPALPFWMGMVGAAFGVLFGKMVFGGFGKNVFNPALVGRAFIYVAFPNPMNAWWSPPFGGFPGGFAHWMPDAVTGATPMTILKEGGAQALKDLFLGSTAGCFGETCALLILLGGIYIIWKKSADYRIVLSGLAGFILLQTILRGAGISSALHPVPALLSGSFLFGLFFFITEPISASRHQTGKWIYGFFYGVMVVIIRTFSVWREAVTFAVLLANVFAPIMDYALAMLDRKSAAKKANKA
ncbi:MAG TPA: RnfABCDGE type electron transport complex subunit D [Candidatus Sumerlaeota bacterium]|nr:RnfABCDGE type electron transport complex subunit D [Candidatus Sumerlaeota bacterium]